MTSAAVAGRFVRHRFLQAESVELPVGLSVPSRLLQGVRGLWKMQRPKSKIKLKNGVRGFFTICKRDHFFFVCTLSKHMASVSFHLFFVFLFYLGI